MKTRLLLIMLVALFINAKQSHASEVFPTSDAIWVIHTYGNGTHQYVYGLSGDTIINEKAYQKLYLLNDTTLTITNEDIYVAGIRQTPEKQVWIQPAEKKDGTTFEEFLMYDFGAEIGAEIIFGKKPHMGRGDWGPTFEGVDMDWIRVSTSKVIEIKELQIGKYFLVNDGFDNDEWIEKIGSLSGLFYYPLLFPSGAGEPQGAMLICMKEGEAIQYLEEHCTSCFKQDFLLSVSSEKFNNDSRVSYNSEEGIVEVTYNNEYIPSEFSLTGIDGQMIFKSLISDIYTSINVCNIPKGIYVYTLKGENTNQSGKLIIK